MAVSEQNKAGGLPPAMRLDIITILPELFDAWRQYGVCGRAVQSERVAMHFWNPRTYAQPPHYAVDDRPYGGGAGMVLAPPPLVAAVRAAAAAAPPSAQRIFLTPRGARLTDALARQLATAPALTILCGRYQGVDERAVSIFNGMEISIGDYVLSGGEVAAMVLLEAVLRHVGGVLGNPDSAGSDAFANGLPAAPCYTRPPVFEGRAVPKVLVSGDHQAIAQWRAEQAKLLTPAPPK